MKLNSAKLITPIKTLYYILISDKTMYRKKSWPNSTKFIIFGWSLLFVGAGLVLSASHIVKFTVDIVFKLTPNAIIFPLWQRPPDPNKVSIYLFNWTNYNDLFNSSVKPKFQEIGPYVYLESREKVNIKFNNNDTVTYKQIKTFEFDEDNSRNINDTVVSINALAIVSCEIKTHSTINYKDTF